MHRTVARVLNAAGTGAALLIVGGIARIIAGVFPLDLCCAPIAPSFSERMHNAAGATYVLATSAAVLIWCSVSERTFRTRAHFGILNFWLFVFALIVCSRLSWRDSSAPF